VALIGGTAAPIRVRSSQSIPDALSGESAPHRASMTKKKRRSDVSGGPRFPPATPRKPRKQDGENRVPAPDADALLARKRGRAAVYPVYRNEWRQPPLRGGPSSSH